MVDRFALDQLFSTYGWPMDSREFNVLPQVFTDDATFTVSIAGEKALGPIEGRDEIVGLVSEIVGGQTDQRRHLITNHRVVSEDGDVATVTANLTLIVIDGGQLEVKSTGIYRCEVVQDDGELRFRSMHLLLDLPF